MVVLIMLHKVNMFCYKEINISQFMLLLICYLVIRDSPYSYLMQMPQKACSAGFVCFFNWTQLYKFVFFYCCTGQHATYKVSQFIF